LQQNRSSHICARQKSFSLKAIGYIKHKAMVANTYEAGLRISEVCALRKSDIDSQRMRI
jgi:integrase